MEQAFAKSKSTCLPTFIFLLENIYTITINLKLNILIFFANLQNALAKNRNENLSIKQKEFFYQIVKAFVTKRFVFLNGASIITSKR